VHPPAGNHEGSDMSYVRGIFSNMLVYLGIFRGNEKGFFNDAFVDTSLAAVQTSKNYWLSCSI